MSVSIYILYYKSYMYIENIYNVKYLQRTTLRYMNNSGRGTDFLQKIVSLLNSIIFDSIRYFDEYALLLLLLSTTIKYYGFIFVFPKCVF